MNKEAEKEYTKKKFRELLEYLRTPKPMTTQQNTIMLPEKVFVYISRYDLEGKPIFDIKEDSNLVPDDCRECMVGEYKMVRWGKLNITKTIMPHEDKTLLPHPLHSPERPGV